MKLQMVGCSHHNSPVELRERLAFSTDQVSAALGALRTRYPGSEAVLLSTCNRIEMYTAAEDPAAIPTHEELVDFIAKFHGLSAIDVFDDLFERTGEDAIRHLFTVAASLDSMVVGEPQILSQVKQAYQLANRCESTGPVTHAVFQSAVRVARRVTSETAIHERRVSIPSLAIADFGKALFERFDDKQVLVLGAGEMAHETLRFLMDEGAADIVILNRRRERAEELAAITRGNVAAWDDRLKYLARADVVISTTGADRPIVTWDDFQSIETDRGQKTLFVLDLAVPRDFDPAIARCLGVYLYSLDDLREACDRNRRERDKELPAALAIIERETRSFMAELHHRATGPIIGRLRHGWQRPKEEEIKRLFNKLPHLDDPSRDEIRHAFDRLINKLLHPPLESLRDEARHGPPHGLLDALQKLFRLRD